MFCDADIYLGDLKFSECRDCPLLTCFHLYVVKSKQKLHGRFKAKVLTVNAETSIKSFHRAVAFDSLMQYLSFPKICLKKIVVLKLWCV